LSRKLLDLSVLRSHLHKKRIKHFSGTLRKL
jgi:hypothetical protein